jgi:hypothetical protein
MLGGAWFAFCTGAVTIMTGFPYIPGLLPEYYLAVGSNNLLHLVIALPSPY